MLDKSIAIYVPELAYRKLQRAARLTYRSVDEVLLDAIETALPSPPDVPAELAEELAALHLFSDEALWAAAAPSMSATEQVRLAQLNQVAGERPLTTAETAEQADLLGAYHRSVLRRAQALAILAQRGHSVTLDSLPLPEPIE
ncbi:MAG: hypothetical protein IAE79_17290 [Anaerolinea sp.]|nr:hypothetical protein [Anaerolinea sp.]